MRSERELWQKPADGAAVKKNWPTPLLLALTFAAAVVTFFHTGGEWNALLLGFAVAASLSAQARRLPLQSVLFAAFITALIGAAADGLSAETGLPRGPLSFGEAGGAQLFHFVPWATGLIWIVAVFNSRGVARLILRPWRTVKNYGFWVIGLTAALSLVFDLALEPFARVKHLWLWQATKIPVNWHGASPLSFVGWTFVTLIILAFVTPFLIRKQPGEQRGPDFAPLALWLGSLTLFAVNSAQAGQWPAVIFDATAAAAVGLLAWRGARW
jgi:uncharacterized membrane protein